MNRPSMRDFFANFTTSDAPLTEKLRMVVRNNARKMRSGSGCCGNYGEPGC